MTRKLLLGASVTMGCLLLLSSLAGCDYTDKAKRSVAEAVKPSVSSQFDIKISNIGIIRETPFSPISAPKGYLPVKAYIQPKQSYGGSPSVYLVAMTKNGYYFGHSDKLTWTTQELKWPDPSERNSNTIKVLEAMRTKTVTLDVIPSLDIDVVKFVSDVEAYAKDVNLKTWQYIEKSDWAAMLSGNTPEELSNKAIADNIANIFNRYFTLSIVTAEELAELEKTKVTSTPSPSPASPPRHQNPPFQ